MKTLAALITLSLAAAAHAEGAPPAPTPAQLEKHMRVERTVALAEALDLDAPHALALDTAMAEFDVRKRPIHEQLHALHDQLERIAQGEAATVAQVDRLLQQLFDAETQLRTLDREMLTSVSRGMTPQQRARFSTVAMRPPHGPPHGAPPAEAPVADER